MRNADDRFRRGAVALAAAVALFGPVLALASPMAEPTAGPTAPVVAKPDAASSQAARGVKARAGRVRDASRPGRRQPGLNIRS